MKRTDYFEKFIGEKVFFIGAGVSHRQLIKRFSDMGISVTLCDKKELSAFGDYAKELTASGVELRLGEGYLDGLCEADYIFRSPGFEFYTPALQKAISEGVRVTSEMEEFFAACPCKIYGVTGSDGKTTTTTLIAKMLEASGVRVHLGGNIGRPLFPVIDEIEKDDAAVVELSSFQLISMRVSPNTALVTNLAPNHLDHHRDMREYIDAKRNILLWQDSCGRAVLNFNNEITREMSADVKGSLRWFSRDTRVNEGAYINEKGDIIYCSSGTEERVLNKDELRLIGFHNAENFTAAVAVLGGDVLLDAMRGVGRSFGGVEHRIEFVRELDGVKWYNDSIATSPTRTIAGLRSFEQKLIIIAGGSDKGIPFEPLADELVKRVKVLVLTGATSDRIRKATQSHADFASSGLKIIMADGMEDAVNRARAQAKSGDIISLSPACASFDAYENFEARGREFKRLVMELR